MLLSYWSRYKNMMNCFLFPHITALAFGHHFYFHLLSYIICRYSFSSYTPQKEWDLKGETLYPNVAHPFPLLLFLLNTWNVDLTLNSPYELPIHQALPTPSITWLMFPMIYSTMSSEIICQSLGIFLISFTSTFSFNLRGSINYKAPSFVQLSIQKLVYY